MAACRVCNDALVLQMEDEDGSDGQHSVPDDLELLCGCHLHWQCLLDRAADVAHTLRCPACGTGVATDPVVGGGPSGSGSGPGLGPGLCRITTRYTNEGGVLDDFDILPSLAEEAYLAAHPRARPARAFSVMCAEGDVEGLLDILRDADADADASAGPRMTPHELLRYQDPLGHGMSGLHVAVEHGQEEVVLLLLWIASALPTEAFPAAAVAAAVALGIHRPAVPPELDIRALTDDRGRTAEAVAAQMPGTWSSLLQAGLLRAGT